MNDCTAVEPRLEEYRVDLLEAEQKRSVEVHLASCADCEAALQRIRAVENALLEAADRDCEISSETLNAGLAQVTASLPRKNRWKETVPMAAAALALIGTFVWLLGNSVPITPGSQEPPGIFEEKKLGTLKDPVEPYKIAWSADGKTWAYRALNGKRGVMDIGGKRSQDWAGLGEPVFSPDGRSIAYVGASPDDGKERVILGNTQGEPFQKIWSVRCDPVSDSFYNENSVVWAPDGHAFAHLAHDGEKQTYVVAGQQKFGPFGSAREVCWSPDGRLVAYTAKIGADSFVGVGDRKGEIFDDVSRLSFGPDGKTIVYVAREGTRMLVMVGDKRQAGDAAVGPPVVSPDGRSVAYAAGSAPGALTKLMVNGVEDARFSVPAPKPPLNASSSISNPTFSPDGTHLAASVSAGGEHFVVVDGTWMPEHFDRVKHLLFSPDSSTVAYVAIRGSKQLVVVGHDIGEKFSTVDGLVFSPDGKSLAYRGERFGKQLVVAGRALSEEFDSVVSGPVYSADSKKVAFVVRKGMELWSKMMDVK